MYGMMKITLYFCSPLPNTDNHSTIMRKNIRQFPININSINYLVGYPKNYEGHQKKKEKPVNFHSQDKPNKM